ncbi:hypothetical protein, partial [Psychroflexus tropicus]|uniref:hypothetical protein n=1 Tax=Psychroflexus tropicus TaxID=197345 RepID=UPI000A02526C
MNKITFFLILGFFSFTSLLAQEGPGGVGSDTSNRFWFIAEDLALPNGSPVSAWNNLGGNSLNALSSGGDPIYNSNFSNGFASVQFAGNDAFEIADNSDLNNSGSPWSARTFNVVVQTGADTSSRQVIYEEGAGVRGLNIYIFNGDLYYGAWNLDDDDGGGAGDAAPWGFSSVQTPVTANTSYIISYVFSGNNTSTGTVECYLDGNLIGTINGIGFLYNHNEAAIGNTGSDGDTYAETGSAVSGDFPFDGDIAEFIMYNTNLNDSERISVENYLSSKYDITLSSNDIYDQDLPVNGDYDFNLVSVNRQSSTDQHQVTNQGTGLISLSTSATLNNSDYFSLGSDLLDQTGVGPITCSPSSIDVTRLSTTWRISKVGTFTPDIVFDLVNIPNNVSNVSDISILIDDNSAFSSPTILDASAVNPTEATFSGLSINAGDYITFELVVNRTIAQSPAGLDLEQELRFAFEANSINQANGTDVTTWVNNGQNILDANTQTNSPSLLSEVINGQDFIQFDSANNESFEIANNADINSGGEPWEKRSYSLVFQTGTDVSTRQVIYEEGGTTRGVAIYILNNEVYFGAYNQSNDGAGSPWNFTSVSAPVTPSTTYVMTNIFSGNSTSTGTLETYLNGQSVGTTSGVGFLYDHGANISLGQNGDGNILESGSVGAGSYFNGLLGEFLFYDTAIDPNQADLLNNFLMAKYGVNPVANDIYAYDTNAEGDFDFNLLCVRQTPATAIEETTYSTGVIKFLNPSTLAAGDAIVAASDIEDQTSFDTAMLDCSTNTADDLRLDATWRIDLQGSPGTIDIELDFNSLRITGSNDTNLDLIIDDNPNFTSPTRISPTAFCSTAIYQNVSFTDGDYFTFERSDIAPVTWDGSNWANGSGPTNEPTVQDEFKKLIISGSGANLVEDASCSCLTVDAGSDLNVDTFDLNVGNNIINNGSVTGDGEVILDGTSAQTISGDGSFENLRLDNPTSVSIDNPLDTPMDLNGVLYVDQGTFNTDNNLYLRCSFTPVKTAQVAPVNGAIVGNVTVEQCFPARRAFRFISSSVTGGTIQSNWQEGVNNTGLNFPTDNQNPNPGFGTHITGSITGANGFDATGSGNPSMFTFSNNVPRQWDAIASTNQALEAGTPYRLFIRGDRGINVTSNSAIPTNTRLRATGALLIGNTTQSVLSNVGGEVSFVANPYQAQVDMNTVLSASTNISTAEYYVWDPTLGGAPTVGQQGGRGAYVTVDLPAGTNSITSSANQYLQPMQAAFVLTSVNGPASVTFEESMKAVEQTQTEVKSLSKAEYINIQLFDAESYAEGNTPSDGLRIKFDKSYNKTTEDDSPKLSNLDENLARVEDNVYSA